MPAYRNREQNNGQFEGIRIISYCPVCSNQYNPFEAEVIDEKNDSYLIYISCRKCSSSIIAMIFTTSFGINSIGMVTDLNSKDIQRFRNQKQVNADDVIEIHQILEANKLIDKIEKIKYG